METKWQAIKFTKTGNSLMVSVRSQCFPFQVQGLVPDQELLLLLSRFSCVRLCVTPQTAAHQAPLSLGFPRQGYWGGLPFASPMHACMLSHFSHVQVCATLWTAAHQAPLSTGFSR